MPRWCSTGGKELVVPGYNFWGLMVPDGSGTRGSHQSGLDKGYPGKLCGQSHFSAPSRDPQRGSEGRYSRQASMGLYGETRPKVETWGLQGVLGYLRGRLTPLGVAGGSPTPMGLEWGASGRLVGSLGSRICGHPVLVNGREEDWRPDL